MYRQELQTLQYYTMLVFIICNYKYISRTIKLSKLSAMLMEDFPLVKGREKSRVRLNRKGDDGQKKRTVKSFCAERCLFITRGNPLCFRRRDASRVAKKRIANAVEKKGGRRRGWRKEMQKECHSRSRSLDGTSRVLMGTGGLKNEHCREKKRTGKRLALSPRCVLVG